ncbi:MAG TPA: ABC transporter permease [Chthoniobacteraceae bacterium]|jgi:ABC-type multidrug transport system ATPase subunit|nr:ABC transporter permease [Chthoniobacteraceae bacterium]
MKFIIGRSPECDLVLNHARVSKRHASLRRDSSGAARLKDERSANGTFINEPSNEIKEGEEAVLRDDDLVYFSHGNPVPASMVLRKFLAWEQSGGNARAVLSLGQAHRFTAGLITLGSATNNQVQLPYLDVWPQHAVIARQPAGGYALQDLGGGCTVDGRPVVRESVMLRPNAKVEFGGVTLSVSFDPARAEITIGAERRGFYLTAHQVTYTIPHGAGTRRLLNDVSFSVMPGEFVGLLGPSGCGKTTLLTCLSGVQRNDGVYYNGEALAATASACANVIGYVPQDDLLYPELTVKETLFYSARLRLNAHTSSERIYTKIDEVCQMLGLTDSRSGLDLRDTLIGSPERKTLSGGQKKRVNLALELLTDPLVLFLDEPTSGLSSRDTSIVMACLRRLADEKGVPIIITIHQPSLRVYQLLDQTLYLKEGRLAWFGPAYPDSVRYFTEGDSASAGADEIMEAIDGAPAETLQRRYESGRYWQKFVQGRGTLMAALTKGGELARPKPVAPMHLHGQFFLLLGRQLVRRSRDYVSLVIQLGQAPLLGLMVGFAFEKARMNSPLFLFSFIAIWFGANATARELVSERSIFLREQRGGVSPAATLLAKLTNHGLMLLLQCVLLFFSANFVIHFDAGAPLAIGILWLSGLCGAALGFVISAFAKSEIAATAATPLVLVPLILFGGYLAPFDSMSKGIKAISEIMPTRWGYQALVEAEQLKHEKKEFERNDPTRQYFFAEFSEPKDGGRVDDPNDRWWRIWKCLGVLAGANVALTGAAWWRLRGGK